jgi:hypothetical protein
VELREIVGEDLHGPGLAFLRIGMRGGHTIEGRSARRQPPLAC